MISIASHWLQEPERRLRIIGRHIGNVDMLVALHMRYIGILNVQTVDVVEHGHGIVNGTAYQMRKPLNNIKKTTIAVTIHAVEFAGEKGT